MLEWIKSLMPKPAHALSPDETAEMESLKGSYARLSEQTRTLMKGDTPQAKDVAKGVLDAMVKRHV